MGIANDFGETTEVDRMIGAVGDGDLNWTETAARMQVLVDALRFYATPANYEEQETHESGQVYYVCPIEEDDCGNLARNALTDAAEGY